MFSETATDPLGRTIFIPPSMLSQEGCSNYQDIKKIISSPSYIIEGREKELFIFRLLEWELNILIEVKQTNNAFVAERCIANPSAPYIAQLLRKGVLTSFT
jgi:hypothetical protein